MEKYLRIDTCGVRSAYHHQIIRVTVAIAPSLRFPNQEGLSDVPKAQNNHFFLPKYFLLFAYLPLHELLVCYLFSFLL